MLHPFSGHVQLENDRESALSFNSKIFQDVNVNVTHLSLAFPKCQVRGAKLRLGGQERDSPFSRPEIKTVCHRTLFTLRCSLVLLR